MADSRSKNVSRNIVFGFSRGLLNTVLPFVTRTVTLYLLGETYLGVGTLFTSVLSMLSLTELGISNAINYVMYEPLAKDDFQTVSSILKYFRKLYRIIGTVFLGVGTLIVPAIPFLIKGKPPAGLNIYLLYYIYLVQAAISYFFAGYRQCLLSANQRQDILSKVTMAVYVLNNVTQVLVLALTRNYYLFATVPVIGTLITNISVLIITKKKYPEIVCEGEVSKEIRYAIKKRVTGLLGTKMNSLVIHQADILVISAFLGLTLVTEYGNYYFLLSTVCALISVFFSSFTASVGNKLVTDSKEENYTFFRRLNGLNGWIVGLCSTFMVVLYQPFMRMWVGERLMLPTLFVFLFTMYFYTHEIPRAVLIYKDASGLWYEDRYRSYITMIFNVVSNLVLVNIIGIYGVVISSILAFCISIPWVYSVLLKYVFKKPSGKEFAILIKNLSVNTALIALTYLVCLRIGEGWIGMVIRSITALVVFSAGYYAIYRKNAVFQYWTGLAANRVRRYAEKISNSQN